MLELSADQLTGLEAVRRDELIEKLLLEVREQDPAWYGRHGLAGGISYLAGYRRDAETLGLIERRSIEDFMRYGMMFPGFNREQAFVEWMARPSADDPDQRFRDYQRVMEFVWQLKHGAWQ